MKANEFDRKFDEGEDIAKHLDASKATMRVLITGSEGSIGRVLTARLTDYAIVRLDRVAATESQYIRSDLQDLEELNANLKRFQPIDCVIHLAAASRMEASWESVLKDNIIGTRNIFESARRNLIPRVIFASSNHVTGLYEGSPPSLHLAENRGKLITTEMEIRPDSYYGVSKAFGEAVGRYYSEAYGIRTICLRIGTVLDSDNPSMDLRRRATWLSHNDLVSLIEAALISDVRYGVYYGVSNNAKKFWDISNAERELGFRPKDDAEMYFRNTVSEA